MNFSIVVIRVIDHFRITPREKKLPASKIYIAKVKKLNKVKAVFFYLQLYQLKEMGLYFSLFLVMKRVVNERTTDMPSLQYIFNM